MLDVAAGLPVEDVPLAEIEEIDSVYWFDEQRPPTVREVALHVRLTQEVDLAHPIILGPDGRVMDGMHRIVRAMLEERRTIAAVRLPELPEPDYRDCKPEELPYPE